MTEGKHKTETLTQLSSTLSLESTLASSSHERNRHHGSDYIAIATHVQTAFSHADLDRDVFAVPPDETELASDGIWNL